MGFLESLREAVRGLPNGRSRSMAERLNLKVMKFYEEGRFREATEAARQLLDIQREKLGEEHADYAAALSNLALLLQRQGDIEGAEPLLRKVLATRKQALGESHPDYATSLNNLGELLFLREDLDGAEPLLHQALAVRKEVLGESHPDYAVSLSSLALLLHKRGDLAGAESLLSQALDIRREMLGEFHPDYAAGLGNLANLLVERGQLTRAEVLMRQALHIRRAALGEHHPDSLATSDNLTRLLRRRAEMPRSEASSARLGADDSDADEVLTAGRADEFGPSSGLEADRDRSPISNAHEWVAEIEGGVAEADDIAARGLEELARLTALFREVGGQLQVAGERMQSGGVFPDPGIFRALAICHYRLSALGTEVRGLAGSLGVACPPEDQVDGLSEIGTLLAAVARVKADRSRSQALAVLERVLGLRPRDPEDLPTLARCQDKARELHRILASSPTSEPPPVAEQLVRGEHPFTNLLSLVNDWESLDAERRADLRRGVAWAFGEPLAEGAAEARLLVLPTASPDGEAAGDADGSQP
jgi:tetratricopeptide (TPR) repeat protein